MKDPEVEKLQNLRHKNRFEARKSCDSSVNLAIHQSGTLLDKTNGILKKPSDMLNPISIAMHFQKRNQATHFQQAI